jgi:hypothetical protein
MAAGEAIEMWSKQTGTAESPDGRRRAVTMTRAFTMTLDADDRLEECYQAANLPLVYDRYPGTQFVICRKLTPSRLAPTLGMVICDYSGEVSPSDNNGSPVETVVKVTWNATVTDEAIDEDWNGSPIVTKNGEPIEGLTEKLADDVVTIERNFLTVNRYALRAYRRAVNSDVFLDWPPGTARIIDDEATATFINGIAEYWTVRMSIQFREPFNTTPQRSWWKRVRHEGYYVRDTAGDDPHIAWDKKTKSPVTKKILLKEDGTREDDPENAFWLEFQTLGSLPYSALGLLD